MRPPAGFSRVRRPIRRGWSGNAHVKKLTRGTAADSSLSNQPVFRCNQGNASLPKVYRCRAGPKNAFCTILPLGRIVMHGSCESERSSPFFKLAHSRGSPSGHLVFRRRGASGAILSGLARPQFFRGAVRGRGYLTRVQLLMPRRSANLPARHTMLDGRALSAIRLAVQHIVVRRSSRDVIC